MIGWKRIVITVGERIGKTHLTYAQGACAEITAAATIAAAAGHVRRSPVRRHVGGERLRTAMVDHP